MNNMERAKKEKSEGESRIEISGSRIIYCAEKQRRPGSIGHSRNGYCWYDGGVYVKLYGSVIGLGVSK
jgi:hypothetical protein